MARFSRLYTLQKMIDIGLVPVFYNPDIEKAKNVAKACSKAGALILEFTNRGDFAYEVFAQLEKFITKECPEIILGVGSVIDPYTAAIYIANGANFIVGPVLNEEVAKICNRRKIPYLPGCGSPSEISKAEELGCEIIKIFPGAQVGGPAFVKAIKGPMPWCSIMPTGGVSPTEESLKEWFEAGVSCVGIGSKLLTKDLINKGDFQTLTENIKKTLKLIKDIRSSL